MERSSTNPKHFPFLDGLRALAALFVVAHHAWMASWHVFEGQPAPGGPLGLAVAPLRFGHAAVTLFIAISGFCLALPVVTRPDAPLQSVRFFTKRAIRILPPYYAALLLGVVQDWYLGAEITPGSIWQHLFLVHNWTSQRFRLNAPLWSIAVECQIYLLFPVMVWLYRRVGIGVLIALSTLLGGFTYWCWPYPDNPTYYLTVFSLGMLAAHLSQRRSRIPYGTLSVLLFAAVAFVYHRYSLAHIVRSDAVVALFSTALLIFCTLNQPSLAVRLLSWRPLVTIGTFSYSLYLIHSPLQLIAGRMFAQWFHLSPARTFAVHIGLLLPLIIAAAWVFYRLLERPFILRKAQIAASPSSAPQEAEQHSPNLATYPS